MAVVIVLAGGIGWYAMDHKAKDTTTTVAATATPQSKDVTYAGKDGSNAMDLLKASFTVETKHYSFGDMVQSINGLAADDTHYWSFYVNGKSSDIGASDYLSKSTDTLEWKYVLTTQ